MSAALLPELRTLVRAGVLSAFDAELASVLGELASETSAPVLLAAAFAAQAVQAGHTCADLPRIARKTWLDAEGNPLEGVRLPAAEAWIAALAASRLVDGEQGDPDAPRPLVLDARGRLYLRRYFDYERGLAEALLARAENVPGPIDSALLRSGLERLFPAEPKSQLQRVASIVGVLRRLTVISGGPGTGKTFTVAKILVLLQEQALARGGAPFRIALLAPTGKAAQRLGDAIRENLAKIACDAAVRAAVPTAASTIHRVLGFRPAKPTSFRHDARDPLAEDVVVVDEASMVDLALMEKLVRAVRPDARLILLGDKDQLASVEAGAILGDLYAAASVGFSERFANEVRSLTGESLPGARATRASPLGDGMVELVHAHRFSDDGGIAELARAVNAGSSERAFSVLARGGSVALRPVADREELERALLPLLHARFDGLTELAPHERLARLDGFRILAAHRRGPFGVETLNDWAEQVLGLRARAGRSTGFYDARPLIVTANDYQVELFNGDIGVIAPGDEPGAPLVAWFRGGPNGLRKLSPACLPRHETAFALSVHKSQGSEFDEVALVLPDRPSPILTRELVYTAVTRAKKKVTLFGSEAVLRGAIEAQVERASGLRDRLAAFAAIST
ncbi:MAG TPA: exodeoxyribonuclease V subunit alpha [Polyangiaceae bacterium]